MKLLLPFVGMFVFWLAAGPLLGVLQVQAPAVSARHLVEQALIIGVGGWLLWQYLLVAVLGLHLVSSYVYLGRAPFWHFVNSTARPPQLFHTLAC